jgi:hypothetical protein
MTVHEVEAVLGRAADHYSPPLMEKNPSGTETVGWWDEGAGRVRVWFDGERRVLDKDSRGLRREAGALTRLRSWLGVDKATRGAAVVDESDEGGPQEDQ